MGYLNITNFVLISYLEKDFSMIEMRLLKNVVIFFKNSFKLCTVRKKYINSFLILRI